MTDVSRFKQTYLQSRTELMERVDAFVRGLYDNCPYYPDTMEFDAWDEALGHILDSYALDPYEGTMAKINDGSLVDY